MKWYLGGPSAYCLLEVVLTLEFAFVGVRLTRLRKTSIRRGLGQDRTQPASDVPAFTAPLVEATKPTAVASAVAQETASTAAPAKIASDSRFGDYQSGSAAISLTRESATTKLHEVPGDNGSCLSTSSFFA